MNIKLRIQLSKNYQVYELETEIDHTQLKETSDKLTKFANAELNNVVELVAGKTQPTAGNTTKNIKLSDKQINFMVSLGGNKEKTFSTYNEFNDYITELKTKK